MWPCILQPAILQVDSSVRATALAIFRSVTSPCMARLQHLSHAKHGTTQRAGLCSFVWFAEVHLMQLH